LAIIGLAIGLGLMPLSAAASELPAPRGGPIYGAIVLDAETGQVLRELNADAVTYPASLTKMMTLYLTFEALNQGRLRLDQALPVSADAAVHRPSKLGLNPGEAVAVRDLILGIVTKSANDAAAVLAEGLGGGSEANFAALMTRKARQLGMSRTQFRNASGLPDPGQLTTARDTARLALALYRDFPREYRYFSVREFEFHGVMIPSHDHLLEWYPGADGLKTGYTVASGFNLASSAVRNGQRLIGVILGGGSARVRDEEMAKLLDLGFQDLGQAPPAQHQLPATLVASASPAPQPQPQPVVAAPAEPEHPRTLGAVASAAIRHLSPVGTAEAAETNTNAATGWSIEVGAFRAESAAEEAARKAARLAAVRGKPEQILPPSHAEHSRLYRARILHFTPQQAQAACETLHRKGMTCSVVRSSGVRVASR
jgi:D-alanyl-D-alanine carboxypeptidase